MSMKDQNRKRRRVSKESMGDSIRKLAYDPNKKPQKETSVWDGEMSEETKEWLIKAGTVSAIIVGAITFGPFFMRMLKKNVVAFKQLRHVIKA